MDLAYDHVQEAVIESGRNPAGGNTESKGLNAELSEAYKAFSNSPWGMKFGAFVGTVKKQGESYYEASRNTVTETATRGFTDLKANLINRTRSLSLTGAAPPPPAEESTDAEGQKGDAQSASERGPEDQKEGFISMLKANAAKRIEEIEKAEAKADEYLLKWGATIGNFLKEAVTIAPPEGEEFADEGVNPDGEKDVLFDQAIAGWEESKRQIYTTRLDAQLHLLHTSLDLFRTDPYVESFSQDWSASFNAEQSTEQIAADLDKYPELRATMEKLVPAEVKYEDFWKRYYFLRAELDAEEQKRKELLKGALEEEEIGWDSDEGDEGEEDEEDEDEDKDEDEDEDRDDGEDDDKEEQQSVEPSATTPAQKLPRSQASTETLQPKSRNSADRASQPDSDTSYDIVSGAASKTASRSGGSPAAKKPVDDDSDEDWE
ncbi:hypothetical protein BDZ91DRAFT_697744 [Kalaharituber pfeilii]|nr:hypothetical protein BDZ91DRAFT_697744 [Kalaharituber pfeilii]